MVGLLDNFLNPLKAFLVADRHYGGKIAAVRRERLAATIQVRSREKGVKQKLLQIESTIKISNDATSLMSLAPDNLGVRVEGNAPCTYM
jgi:hypothetical protein